MIPEAKIKVLRTTAATGKHLEEGQIAVVTESDARILIKLGKAVPVIGKTDPEQLETRPEPAINERKTKVAKKAKK